MTAAASQTLTALIAEDEPLLAAALTKELSTAWPELQLLGVASNGLDAESMALALQPDVLFFDIKMPGQSGLEAALALADQWGLDAPSSKPFPALVFVTAFDHYAAQAFDAQALDYLVKPITGSRLAQCVRKVKAHLAKATGVASGPSQEALLTQLLAQLAATQQQLIPNPTATKPEGAQRPRLQVIQASQGNTIHMVEVNAIVYLQALDKYVQVVTADGDYLLRTPLKDLLDQMDPDQFWQIHRSTAVRANAITKAVRDESGKLKLELKGRAERLTVSRLYGHLFRGM